MSGHVTDHLSDYLDGELSAGERAAVDAHLHACAECAGALAALRRIVAHAAAAADHDVAPPRDLWSGIRARIESSAPLRMASETARPPRARRRVALTIPQLAAAAVLLVAASATFAWMLRGAAPAPAASAVPAIEAEIEPIVAAADARLADFADAHYDAAVTDLERTLRERRNDLHPRTVEILERNVKLIDAAIAQARQALERDPGNTYLNRHLVDSRRRKLDLLRRAAAISEGD